MLFFVHSLFVLNKRRISHSNPVYSGYALAIITKAGSGYAILSTEVVKNTEFKNYSAKSCLPLPAGADGDLRCGIEKSRCFIILYILNQIYQLFTKSTTN